MKKVYKYFGRFILGLLVFGASFSSFSQITSYPHYEGFEGGSIPSGWTQEHESGSVDWIVTNLNGDNTVNPRTGNGMAHFHSGSTGEKTKLVSPQLDLTSLTVPYLSFYFANAPWSSTITELRMYYKSAAGDSWTQIGQTIDTKHTSWTEVHFVLPNSSADYYIAFEGHDKYGYGVELDDIVIGEGPSCMTPSDLTGINATSTSVDLGWTENGDATTWNIEYGAPGFTPGTDTQAGKYVASTSTYAATLTPDTDYDFYVQADCGGDQSGWNGPYEAYYCGASASNTSIYFSEITSTDAETNLSYMETAATSDYIDKTGETFQLMEEQTVNIKTSYNNSSNPIHVNIWIDWNNDFSFDNSEKVVSEQNPVGTGTVTASIDVPAGTPPGEYRMRVRGSEWVSPEPCDYLGYYNATVDFNLTILSACSPLTNLIVSEVGADTAVVTWDANGTSSWIIEYDTVGFTQGSSSNPLLNTTDNPATLLGLSPEYSYDVYVWANCGSDGTSDTLGPINFTTQYECSAGKDGTLEVCKNESFDLFDGLIGSVNTTDGTWYNSSNTALQSSLDTASNIPGEYNYEYIISSGDCPADTAIVVISVKPDCDHLGLNEDLFTDISVYPNPATSKINIITPGNTSSLTVEMLDMNGRIVLSNKHALENTSGATIAIEQLERGVYTLRVYNESGQKTFKIVKQ